MTKEVDVLVIGVGPAGGSAAKIAAEAGLSVFAVEKKKTIGSPVQCAEFIPLPMSKYATEMPVRRQKIMGMKNFLPSGEMEETEFPGLMIDRQKFDENIANNAKKAGAEIIAGAQLVLLDAANSLATVTLADEKLKIKYKTLIAADGPHSKVAKCLGLPELDTVSTRQYTVPLKKAYSDTDIWLSDEYPGGYAWMFPKGEWANIGLGASKAIDGDLKAPLDRLHKQLVDQGLLGEEIVYRTGGAIPVGGLREALVHNNIVFVGDAAGLTHPITGAGISAGVMSGEMAGDAVAQWLQGDDEALTDYEEEIRDQFEVTLNRAVNKRQWLKTVWRTQLANDDKVMRKGWIAFDEYMQPENSPA